jgi:hypothetical protein
MISPIMTPSESLAIVACVEAGPLEEQAVMLFESMRKWGGRHADARLVSVEPRGETGLDPETVETFATLGVEHHSDNLNVEFADNPMVNRLYAGAWAEGALGVASIALVDTDTVFFNPPDDLTDLGDAVAVRPVGQKKRGSYGPDDFKDRYWQKMYKLCGSPEGPWVETVWTGERIRGYWSAGVVAAPPSRGVFGRWLENFRTLIHEDHIPKAGPRNMDQLSLAATLPHGPVKTLDGRYNYLVRRRPKLPPELQALNLDEIVHLHYRHWFHQPGFLDQLEPPFKPSPQLEWLEERLPLVHPGEGGHEGSRFAPDADL